MNRMYDRFRDLTASAGGGLRDAMNWHEPRGRVRLIVAGTAATVLAIGVGVWWGIAGADRPPPPSATALAASPSASPEALSDSAPAGSPGREQVTGGGPPAGSNSDTDTGAGSAGSPPVIEDPGLSSDGLRLRIAPIVTVSGERIVVAGGDGAGVTVRFLVDGDAVPFNAMDPDSELVSIVQFDHDQVGYTHRATVAIEVTDGRGTRISETFVHDLEAVTTVTVREVTFRLQAPTLCFASGAAKRLEGDLRLRGAVTADLAGVSEELRPDRTTVVLLDRTSGEVSGPPATQRISLSDATLDGVQDSASFSHDGSAEKLHRLFEGTACRGYFSYKVAFTVR